ncbi:MAG: FMN-dependent NADH-azoreductase [Hyphomonas sp.]
MTTLTNILRIDASARQTDSVTRELSDKTIDRFATLGAVQVTSRDVARGLPFVDEAWVTANFTPEAQRTNEQRSKLSQSDQLVDEVQAADLLVIGMPIYNFGIPASLKAWIDMICRVGRTFYYSENGPVGLMTGKRAIILIASGGTELGSEIDFASPYIRHALNFIGIQDITFIAADGLGADAEQKLQSANAQINALSA